MAHDEERTADLVDVQIHRVVAVVEDTEFAELGAKPVHVLGSVGLLYAKQYHHSEADFRFHLPANRDGSVGYSLCYNSHFLLTSGLRDFETTGLQNLICLAVPQSRVS